MRVAVLSDIHGNVDALRAVLADVEREQPDALVFGGDVATGPLARETLAVLMQLRDAQFVRGNADRHIVEAYDDPTSEAVGDESRWLARQLSLEERDFLAGFQETAVLDVEVLGPTRFCHGSPRSDEEVMTRLTPEDRLTEFVSGTNERLVVCGHTHMQFDRQVGETRILNAGSVGMPYEGRRAAYWLLLGPEVEFRRTDYDVDAAAERLAAHPQGQNHAQLLRQELDPEAVAAFFEGIGPEPELR